MQDDKTGLRPQTVLVHAGRDAHQSFGFVNPPLVRGSTVLHDSVADMRERIRARNAGEPGKPTYGIWGTPTHEAFYAALNTLEGGFASWAFASGLAACTVPILAFVGAGDHVLVTDSAYGPTRDFCRHVLPRFGVEVSFYDPCIGADLAAQFRPTTRVLVLEAPGSHSFEMQDVPLLAGIARAHGAVSMIDNTWATPLHFQPLKHGVDLSIHAATKYICGHADVLMGTVTANERAWPQLKQMIAALGQCASPDDVYLAHRGLHTMAARLAQHEATARTLIAWFQRQPEVERVLWPALPEDPGHALWQRDFSGATGLFGVVLHPQAEERFVALVDALQLFGRGYSWGGYESLLIPSYAERAVRPWPYAGRTVRVAAGLEDPADLIDDLERGFAMLRG
jgi:cystathionine beta-lyase